MTESVRVGPHRFALRRPRDPEELLDERAFELQDEFLPYWAELWPSALALAEALIATSDPLPPLHEIGCGLGVPAIAAALAGADVVASDWSREAVALLKDNAAAAGAPLTAVCGSWADPLPVPPRPLVLAADVLYERRNCEQLRDALPRLVAGGGEAWVADPGRPFAKGWIDSLPDSWDRGAIAHGGPPSVTIHRLRRVD